MTAHDVSIYACANRLYRQSYDVVLCMYVHTYVYLTLTTLYFLAMYVRYKSVLCALVTVSVPSSVV